MRYTIPVENIEDLRRKVATISKKAAKHGVTITFAELGEVIKEVKNDRGYLVPRKFVEVEAEGEAKFEGWVFAGTIEHTECGNILRSVSDEHKIPERYRDAKPYCEHCKTMRYRKDTYIVYNEETGEFKQVGKTCLKEYTNGLSVEMAALVLQYEKEVEEARDHVSGGYFKFFEVTEVSKYFAEALHKFGWASSSSFDSTKARGMDFYYYDRGELFPLEEERVEAEKKLSGFDKDHVSDEYVEAALQWARDWDGHEYNDYRDNLKVIASMKYCEYKHLGYLASLFMSYDKAVEREVKRMARAASKAGSQYIANVGDRITVSIKSGKCLTSWETDYGVTFLYEFITEDGNVIIWKTGKYLDEEATTSTIKGTVKAHNEFNGVKQTELTRCKIA